MSSELTSAIQQIADEKGLSVESIIETIELALAAAYRKDFGNKLQNIKVEFDLETGDSHVFDVKTVVSDELVEEYHKELEAKKENEESADAPVAHPAQTEDENEDEEEVKFNPKTMIGLSEAKEIKKSVKLDEELRQELEVPQEYGRMAAQTAKQVIIQKIREAERESIYETFKEREHDLITGMIQRVELKVILVDIDKTTAIMPVSEQIKDEKYRIGTRMKFYIKEVSQTPKGPEIIISRSHPEMIRKLFMIEVPEISSGTVIIKAIAREAGARSKIAVISKEDNVDPIGACVGQRGARVQTIINELGGEKIDIIEFSEDINEFIANALSPAKIMRVEIDEENKQAKVYVTEDQLSLAIGKGGQNVRLAARLTGWRMDVVEQGSGEIKVSSEEESGDESAEHDSDSEEQGTDIAAETDATESAVEPEEELNEEPEEAKTETEEEKEEEKANE